MNGKPLFEKIDCVRFYVPDIESGLAFYCEKLGHKLVWRSESAAGLRMPDSNAEIVIQAERPGQEIDFKVRSADEASERFLRAGGSIIIPPFEIQIGRAAVVEDPWGNRFVLLDSSKGLLRTDEQGNILGNIPGKEN
jgi:predicted enzyme related to lactoylglutathione lyase